ncbi:unnamed protein product [Phytophthora fragariaefolia]|uniref:Unnamed protein product n=1 Tax=Phytophthora fragariaefolia TaxID=1490495 RepID=A0A9W6XYX0_9STRA|nr:unnamed protein product [Phytophthora fragariaefolia]
MFTDHSTKHDAALLDHRHGLAVGHFAGFAAAQRIDEYCGAVLQVLAGSAVQHPQAAAAIPHGGSKHCLFDMLLAITVLLQVARLIAAPTAFLATFGACILYSVRGQITSTVVASMVAAAATTKEFAVRVVSIIHICLLRTSKTRRFPHLPQMVNAAPINLRLNRPFDRRGAHSQIYYNTKCPQRLRLPTTTGTAPSRYNPRAFVLASFALLAQKRSFFIPPRP